MIFRSALQSLTLWRTEYARLEDAISSVPPGAYTAVIIKEAGDRGRFLLQRRVRPDKLYYGRIATFGGHREGNESPEECAVREIREETGVDLALNELTYGGAVHVPDNRGHYAIGHVFFVRNFDASRLQLGSISEEGKLVRLRRDELPRHFFKLTPITAMALLLFLEHECGDGN